MRDFLFVIAGAISERLTDDRLLGEKEGLKKSFWERARGLLPTGIVLTDVSVKTPAGDLKVALKSDQTFRDKVRAAFAGRIGVLVDAVRKHHAEVLAALSARAGREVRVVVILDSLEHLRGNFNNAKAVQVSVQEQFITHADDIWLPGTHMVVSVPAFLVLEPTTSPRST